MNILYGYTFVRRVNLLINKKPSEVLIFEVLVFMAHEIQTSGVWHRKFHGIKFYATKETWKLCTCKCIYYTIGTVHLMSVMQLHVHVAH